MQIDRNIPAWLRQPGETVREFERFKQYLALGAARTLYQFAHDSGLSYGHVRNMAAAGHWTERAHAYEQHMVEMERIGSRVANRRALLATDEGLRRAADALQPAIDQVEEMPVKDQMGAYVAVSREIRERARLLYPPPQESAEPASLADAIGSEFWAQLCEVLDQVLDDEARMKLARLLEERARPMLPGGDEP
ncbi:hypothetical protein ACMATS_05940 [Streptoverticillium reticulum]|uniref:hypothetical protein n=1 Tax=Streptoverticillium reticulum TaxID=1433415 RepID=UPI0039BFB2DE